MKIADKLFRYGFRVHRDVTLSIPEDEYRRDLAEVISRSVHIDISNVAAYHSSHVAGKTVGDALTFQDVPSPAPPFDDMWVEWVYHGEQDRMQVGIEVVSIDDHDDRIMINGTIFICPRQEKRPMLIGRVYYYVDRITGQYIDNSASWALHEELELLSVTALSVLVTAIGFMHCKNVETVADDVHPKIIRAFKKRNGREPIQFKTLIIDPMKQVLRTEGSIDHNGLKKALHICRGHFAHYTDDKPLFGKYTGTFWRPAHVRGSAESGTVYKDYKIKPPHNGKE